MNGSAVPRQNEILLSSAEWNHYRFEAEGTVTVGSGTAVWDLDQMLQGHGFELLVCNDGGSAAPSVGGFAAAGGIGSQTWLQGGFWESVAELLVVTGAGEVLRLVPSDELFPWMFGSMGQLAVIFEAKLEIRRQNGKDPRPYPLGMAGRIERSAQSWEQNAWFSLFVPEADWKRALGLLEAVVSPFGDLWLQRSNYIYMVRFRSFNPPLVYPKNESFAAVGVWGEARDSGGFDFVRLRELERKLSSVLDSEPSFRRYIQTELTFEGADFSTYFGEEIHDLFFKKKQQYDPNMLLGSGLVFPMRTGPT